MTTHRHHRQSLLTPVGEAGQRRLGESSALIVGCGALGCVTADALCRAGVGRLTIVDRDFVELTNLQRQVLFDERDAAESAPKAEAAKRRLGAIDAAVRVDAVVDDFNARNAERIVHAARGEAGFVIVDGTDNFETRYLLNDLAVKHAAPFVYAGVIGTVGMQMTVLPRAGESPPWAGFETPCLRCVFEEPPPPGSAPTCDTAGVLGPAVSVVAGVQAAEALKCLLGDWRAVSRSLLAVDLWSNDLRRTDLAGAAAADCPCCARRKFRFLNAAAGPLTTSLCGRDSVQIVPAADGAIDLSALAARLAPHGRFAATRFLLRGALEQERADGEGTIELTVFPNGRAIVKGTTRPERARAVYARYVGA